MSKAVGKNGEDVSGRRERMIRETGTHEQGKDKGRERIRRERRRSLYSLGALHVLVLGAVIYGEAVAY